MPHRQAPRAEDKKRSCLQQTPGMTSFKLLPFTFTAILLEANWDKTCYSICDNVKLSQRRKHRGGRKRART